MKIKCKYCRALGHCETGCSYKKDSFRRKKIPIFLTPLQAMCVLKFIEDFESLFKFYYRHPYMITHSFRKTKI